MFSSAKGRGSSWPTDCANFTSESIDLSMMYALCNANTKYMIESVIDLKYLHKQ